MKTFLAVLFAFSCSANNWYVSKTGLDGNPGNDCSPFLTVQRGVNAALPGDTVYIGPGNFDEYVITARNGTGDGRITIVGSGSSVDRLMLKHSYITLRNLEINGVNTPYQGQLEFWTGAHHNIVQDCLVDAMLSPSVYGIRWETTASNQSIEASDNIIERTTVRNVAGYPMIGMGGRRNILRNCIVRDGTAVDFLRLTGISNFISGNFFANNRIGQGGHPDFVQTFGNNGEIAYGHIIENNVVDGIPGGQLFQFSATGQKDIRDWIIRGNIFKNAALSGGGNVQGMKFYNNVFYKIGSAISFSYRGFGVGTGINPGFPIYGEMTQPTPSGQLVSEGDGGLYRYGGYYQVKTRQIANGEALVAGKVYEARTRLSGLIWYNGQSYSNEQTFTCLPGITSWNETASEATDDGNRVALEATQLYLYCQLYYMGKAYRRDGFFPCKPEDRTYTVNQPGVEAWRIVVDMAHRCEMKNNVFLDIAGPGVWQAFYAFDLQLTNVVADWNYVGKDGYQPVRVREPHNPIGSPLGWGGKGWWEDHGINGGDPGLDLVTFQLLPTSILRGRGENGVNIGAFP